MGRAFILLLFLALPGGAFAQSSGRSDWWGMPDAAVGALITATVALFGVLLNGWFTWRTFSRQKELAASNALTSYQFEARKRLYTECEPILFQLGEACERAFQTCALLGTKSYCDKLAVVSDAERRDPDSWMLCRATETIATAYDFLHPLALFFLLRDKMTRVDCTLDAEVSFQYRLARLLVRSFQDDSCIAELDPLIPYTPRVKDWREKRRVNPARYWRQGVTPGRLDRAVRMVLATTGETRRVLTYGEFEDLYVRLYKEGDRESQKTLGVFANPLYGFAPHKRPVFWRLALIQAHLHRALSHPIPKGLGNAHRSEATVRDFLKLPHPELFDLAPDKGWQVRMASADRTPDAAMTYLVRQLVT